MIINEGYCKGDLCGATFRFGSLLSPPALNDNEDLTHLTQLAWHHAVVTCPRLWHTVQKLNFRSDAYKQQKGRKSERIYIVSDPGLISLCHPATVDGGKTREAEEEMETGENIGWREKQWLTGLTGERIFTKLDINCSALHLRQGTCKVS